jgi:uncharacterized protein YbaR (Trm112 family)
MKHRLMDLLACPIDKSWPLKIEIEEEEIESETIPIPLENAQTNVICNYFCNFKQYFLVNINEDSSEIVKNIEEIKGNVTINDCKECFQIEIQKGKIYCSKDEANHVYNIKEGIPIMLTSEQIEELYGRKKP